MFHILVLNFVLKKWPEPHIYICISHACVFPSHALLWWYPSENPQSAYPTPNEHVLQSVKMWGMKTCEALGASAFVQEQLYQELCCWLQVPQTGSQNNLLNPFDAELLLRKFNRRPGNFLLTAADKKNQNSILLFPEALGTSRPIYKLLGVTEVR